MRLDRLTPAHVRRAVRIYLDIAWPAGGPAPRFRAGSLEGCATLEEVFARFDRPDPGEEPRSPRHVLRLGNAHYPFMKLVVWEYLVHREYFFSVDTHDDLAITPDMPDFEGWVELRRTNRELKERIETAWNAAGLPTHEDLRALMEGIARLERGEAKAQRILLVDDEEGVARGLAAVLRARGYQVETAFDGSAVLARLERTPRPDLLVLDYSMPELDGREVIRRMRADDRHAEMPVLLATARSFELGELPPRTGFLRKPYPRELLFKLIAQMLPAPRVPGSGAPAPSSSPGPHPGAAPPGE